MKVYKMNVYSYNEWSKGCKGSWANDRKVLVKANNAEEAKKLAKTLGKSKVYVIIDEPVEVDTDKDFEMIWIEPLPRHTTPHRILG